MRNQTSRKSFILRIVSVCALVGFAVISPRAQAQGTPDRVAVPLSDPSRPATIKASMVNGSIIVKAHDGKDVIVEARPRSQERERNEGGPRRLNIGSCRLGRSSRGAHGYDRRQPCGL